MTSPALLDLWYVTGHKGEAKGQSGSVHPSVCSLPLFTVTFEYLLVQRVARKPIRPSHQDDN